MNLLFLLLRNPIRTLRFLYTWLAHSSIIILKRLLLPHLPHYQSLRLQLQRAYFSSCSTQFPDLMYRLPVGTVPDIKARKVNADFVGYFIPGWKAGMLDDVRSESTDRISVVLYAHGGGYARGEAKMYIKYMERWENFAANMGIRIVFLSVEYPLTDVESHPSQRDSFLKAYEYILSRGVAPENVAFMGDSAGGGNCVLSGIECLKRGLPQPSCSILISPWLDPTMRSHEGGNALVETDYVIAANESSPTLWANWLNGLSPESSEVNPLSRSKDEIHGLNPQLILVGGAEFAREEGAKWAARCKEANVRHRLITEWGQLHNFALGSSWVDPEVRRRIDETIFGWMRTCLGKNT